MINWKIEEEGFTEERITANGNKFLVGNGYMGIRGTLPEFDKNNFTAVNLAGIYDQVGDAWREPLNAPNGLYTRLEFDGASYGLPDKEPVSHTMSLDYRHGIFSRNTCWNTEKGILSVTSERFASLQQKHLIVMKYTVTSGEDGEIKLITGIDGDVWDINGPHYDEMLLSREGNMIRAVGITHECKERVCVCETVKGNFTFHETLESEDRKILRNLEFTAKAGLTYILYKFIAVFTGRDREDYMEAAAGLAESAGKAGYDEVLKSHIREWEEKWSVSEVTIQGDDAAMEGLNYSIYQLHCIAPRHSGSLSIAARGLSCQTYKGAVFWDTEMFMLDFFLLTEPDVAKTLLRYRIDTLDGALEKAQSYGYAGAFYAWESQEGGFDACSDYNVTDVFTGRQMRTYFKDKQIHISSAVVYGIMRYVDYTGDYDILFEGGSRVILECARFYYDLLVKKVHLDQYELYDVIGPDEYHERVNNNAYTNRMAKYTFDSAVFVIEKVLKDRTERREDLKEYNLTDLKEKFKDAANKLYVPRPDEQTGIIEQFDGYNRLEDVGLDELKGRLLHEKEYWGGAYGVASHTKIIKQADVVTMMNLFSGDYRKDLMLKNWEYYEPRTEHGSSLSACMYAMLACKCGLPDRAYPLFMKSAEADLNGGGKQWAGLIYIGGTHPAASGGAYMTAVEGFAGIHAEEGVLKAKAALPKNWKSLSFKLVFHGTLYEVTVAGEKADIIQIG